MLVVLILVAVSGIWVGGGGLLATWLGPILKRIAKDYD